MEKYDVLNERGNSTGVAKTKDEVHKEGLWHKAVHVWLVNNKNEVLLQLRSKTKRAWPNYWDISVAGHISAGEDSLTSAIREVSEEIGVELQKEDFTLLGTIVERSVLNDGTYINNEYDDVYLVRKDFDVEQFTFNDNEVERVEYVSVEQFKDWIKNKKTDLIPHPEEYEMLLKAL